MTNFYEIPMGPSARTMRIALDGTPYTLRLAYADAPDGGWFLDIADAQGNTLIAGLMLTSDLDMLATYPELGIGVRLYLVPRAGAGPLTYDNLGVSWRLIYTVD